MDVEPILASADHRSRPEDYPVASSAKWMAINDRKDVIPALIHSVKCDPCDDYLDHVLASAELVPLPDQVIYQHLVHISERFNRQFRKKFSILKLEDSKALAKEDGKGSLLERIDLSDSAQDPQDSEKRLDAKAEGKEKVKQYNIAKREPIPFPILEKAEDSPVQWIIDAADKGFKVPAQIYYRRYSAFQSVEDFFTIDDQNVQKLSNADYDRYLMACRNTGWALRTEIMDVHYDKYYSGITTKRGQPILRPPAGLPEKWWGKVHVWIQNPSGIPLTIREDRSAREAGVLEWISTTTNLWVSDITSGRDYHLTNLLLILFMEKARAAEYIWENYLVETTRPPTCSDYPLPWQVRVPENLGYVGSTEGTGLSELAGFLVFIVRDTKFPITDREAILAVSTWADDFLSRRTGNPFSGSSEATEVGARRLEIIDQANCGQAWV